MSELTEKRTPRGVPYTTEEVAQVLNEVTARVGHSISHVEQTQWLLDALDSANQRAASAEQRLADALRLLDLYEKFDTDPANVYSRYLASLRIRSLRAALAEAHAADCMSLLPKRPGPKAPPTRCTCALADTEAAT